MIVILVKDHCSFLSSKRSISTVDRFTRRLAKETLNIVRQWLERSDQVPALATENR